MSKTSSELRLLTLKRWALPHKEALASLPLKKRTENFGDYISFQNFDFIDIDPVMSCSISDAYSLLEKKRKRHASHDCSFDICIQQSLVLLGEKSDFWQTVQDKALSITMIQLLSPESLDPENLAADLKETFIRDGGQAAVYFSLDYCDLVVFTRGVELNRLHKKLWSILYGSQPLAKDSVTMLCFPYGPFVKALGEPESSKPLIDHPLSLIMDLNVRSLDTPYRLEEEMRRIGLSPEPFQITGHYDLRVIVRDISPSKLYSLINLVDKHCRPSAQGGYINCEAVSICPLPGKAELDKPSLPFSYPDADRELAEKLNCVVEDTIRQFRQLTEKSKPEELTLLRQAQRLSELYNSLLILHQNRSSEEFVLSVLPALRELIPICKNYACAYIHTKSLGDSRALGERELFELLYTIEDDILRTVNMLVQCTMHSEREWIQAPSFNFTLFDIPPKLLVFYAAIIDRATRSLNDEPDRSFSFLISPEFRPVIQAQALSRRVQTEQGKSSHSSKLLLIGLREEDFYHPTLVIEALCHEAAHYVSGKYRFRRERAIAIFRCLAAYLLGTSLQQLHADDFPTERELPFLIEALGALLLEDYEMNVPHQELIYYSSDLQAYFLDRNGIQPPFLLPAFKSILRAKFAEALGHWQETSLKNLAESLDNTYCLVYFVPLLEDQTLRPAALDTLAGQLVQRLSSTVNSLIDSQKTAELRYLKTFFSSLVLSFNEVYADLRMIELLGISDFSEYKRIAQRYLKSSDEKLQNHLRYNGLLQSGICANLSGAKRIPLSLDSSYELKYCGHYTEICLASYVQTCHSHPVKADVSEAYRNLCTPDSYLRMRTIYSTVRAYKKSLVEQRELTSPVKLYEDSE